MRSMIVGVLAATFAAGMSTGVLVGRHTAKPAEERTWIDGCIEQLKSDGVTRPDDLEAARQVYVEYQDRVLAFRKKVDEILRDQLRQLAEDAERQIREIRARYELER